MAFVVDDYGWLVAFHYCDTGISCSEVDSDNFSHNYLMLLFFLLFIPPNPGDTWTTTKVVPVAIN